ncbi:MAG: cupin domain-containing protein [Desulfatirhabdiaceae bacterium]
MKSFPIRVFMVLSVIITSGCATSANIHPLSARRVIDSLKLLPMSDAACPGFFRPTYESGLKADMDKSRSAASLIYYMMTSDVRIDPWHILTSDEILLYHAGAPMIQMLLYPDGSWEEIVLGPKADQGHVMQQVIPAGTWMGFVMQDDPDYNWGLYGVMVVPGWHIEDIRMVRDSGELKMLEEKYPATVLRGKELGLF